MGKGLGRVELLILDELKYGDALTLNELGIAAAGLKGIGVLELSYFDTAWQSTARAVRSLVKKGLVVHVGDDDGKKLYQKH